MTAVTELPTNTDSEREKPLSMGTVCYTAKDDRYKFLDTFGSMRHSSLPRSLDPTSAESSL